MVDEQEDKTLFIVWKEEYSVKNKKLDNQHKVIFITINELYESFKTKKDFVKRNDIFGRLFKYTQIHFRDEEKLMKIHNYPELNKHKLLHEAFQLETSSLKRQYHDKFGDISLDLFAFLKHWWLDHILTNDRKYIPYINQMD